MASTVPVKVEIVSSPAGPVVDQIGGINAALRLCPLDCHKNWLRRCNVCDSLENARRLAEMRQP